MLRTLSLLLLIPLAICVAGCSAEAPATDPAAADDDRYTIVVTIGMVADVVTQVAGDRAEVITLISPGVDPHLYNPTSSDVERMREADVIFYNGNKLEGKMTETLERSARGGQAVFAVTELLDDTLLLPSDEYEGINDPHAWMNPSVWASVADVVRESLSAFDPDGASIYATNAEAYAGELLALDAYAERVLTSVPEARRVLITAHDAFNYFGQRYGYEVVGVQGLSTESEAGVRDIERLVSMIVDRGIGAVFVESTVSDRNVSALVSGALARGQEVVIGGELYSDAMGDAGTYTGTYIGMIDHNVSTVARALGGEVPEGGFRSERAE